MQTALHAAPEGLILVQHSWADTPLESLVGKIRPSLVLLVRPAQTEKEATAGWLDSLHDLEGRQAYELRALESLGEDAPQVRFCPPDASEACKLILEFLSRPSEDDDEQSDGTSDRYGVDEPLPLGKSQVDL